MYLQKNKSLYGTGDDQTALAFIRINILCIHSSVSCVYVYMLFNLNIKLNKELHLSYVVIHNLTIYIRFDIIVCRMCKRYSGKAIL